MSARRRRIPQVLSTCAALAGASPAHAHGLPSDSVTVVLGSIDDEGVGKILLRMQGELVADGFRVESVRALAELTRQELVRDRCSKAHGAIAVGVFLDERAGDLEMIFCDPVSGREAVRRARGTPLPNGDPPEAVARHTVDVLRAAMLDFAVETLMFAARPPPEASAPSAPPVQTAPRMRGAIEFGAMGLVNVGVDPSIAPMVRLRLGVAPRFQLRITGAGLGTAATVDAAHGSATVSQALAVGEAAFVLAPTTWLRPLVSMGAGVYTVRVSGEGQAPYTGATSRGTAFAVDGGIGVAPWITSSLAISLEVHVVCTLPAMGVRFLDADAARLGQPLVLVTLSLTEWI